MKISPRNRIGLARVKTDWKPENLCPAIRAKYNNRAVLIKVTGIISK